MLSWPTCVVPLVAALAGGCGAADAGPGLPDAADGDDTGGFADASSRADAAGSGPDASTELPERVDIVVESVKFAPTYMEMPWDGAAGSKPDPFVFIRVDGGAAGSGRTETAVDVEVADYGEVVLEDVSVETLLDTSLGVSVLDEDATEAESVRSTPSNPDYPDDDYVMGLGTLVFERQLDGSEQAYESDYEGVNATVLVRFVPSP